MVDNPPGPFFFYSPGPKSTQNFAKPESTPIIKETAKNKELFSFSEVAKVVNVVFQPIRKFAQKSIKKCLHEKEKNVRIYRKLRLTTRRLRLERMKNRELHAMDSDSGSRLQ